MMRVTRVSLEVRSLIEKTYDGIHYDDEEFVKNDITVLVIFIKTFIDTYGIYMYTNNFHSNKYTLMAGTVELALHWHFNIVLNDQKKCWFQINVEILE